MSIQLKNEETKKKLAGIMDDGGEARLPFSAPVMWVLNGKQNAREMTDKYPALYFGGWASNAEEFEMHVEEIGIAAPQNLVKCLYYPKDGEPVEIYAGRFLSIAPVAKRLSSVNKQTGERVPGYAKGASPHLQIVALVSYLNKSDPKNHKRVHWSPVVLSAKGFQVGYVLDTFRDWKKLTAKARRQFAPGLDAELFYMTIGTFADKIETKSVGTQSQSPITPIKLWTPGESGITEQLLTQLFVGDEIADKIADLREQAQEWMNAWKSPVKKQPGAPEENGEYCETPEEQSETIPF